jgi:DNA-binding transcriptional MocR family regulator
MRIISGPQLSRLLGDWRGAGSAYQTLAGAIGALVQDGRLPLGARLPAERELAGALKVSRTTVAATYERLRTDGYVRSKRGSGSIVTMRAQASDAGIGLVAAPSRAGVLDLAVAAMPAPQPALRLAAQAAVELLPDYAAGHGYSPGGLLELRESIAADYQRRGVPTRAEEILVTNGAQHGLDLLIRLLCRPGERVLVECPTYPNALAAISGNGCRAVPVGLGDDEWDVELFSDTMRQSTPALSYLIPDYQNPTGRLMSGPGRAALADTARRTGSYLISDESFTALGFNGAPVPAPFARYDGGERVLSLGSMSKSHWGGLRLGWIRGSAPIIRRLAELRSVIDMSPPMLEQLVSWQLLESHPDSVRDRVAVLTQQRDTLVDALHSTFPDWSFYVPNGGMALWVRLEAAVSSALVTAASRHGVLLASGTRFGVAATMESYLRIPFALAETELIEAVARLARAHSEMGAGGESRVQVA